MSGASAEMSQVLADRALPPRNHGLRPIRSVLPLPPRAPNAAAWATNATFLGRDDLTDDVARFVVRPDHGPRPFAPGQYLSLGLPVAGAVVQRPYSTASSPGSVDLEFLIRRVPGGTFTPALWAARAGSRLSVGRAKGVFTLRPDDDRAHLFIATGTGLAPIVAMLRAVRDRSRPPRAVVVHGVARVAELGYRDRLADAQAQGGVTYMPAISRPGEARSTGWTGAVGRVTEVLPPLFRAGALEPQATVAYVCGNPGMIVAAGALLVELGMPPDAIVSERYWASAPT
jgi:ferredoxin-NADP reductase